MKKLLTTIILFISIIIISTAEEIKTPVIQKTKKSAINKPASKKTETIKPAVNKPAANKVKTNKAVANKGNTRKTPKFTRLTNPIKINSLSAQNQTFKDVVIEEKSDKGVMVMHKNGASFIKKDSLPDDLKKKIYK